MTRLAGLAIKHRLAATYTYRAFVARLAAWSVMSH
jgi:hypothetical protein